MDNSSTLQYDDSQSLYSEDVKLFNFPDANHPTASVANSFLNNSPTYTPLEPLYPSALPPHTSSMQYMGTNASLAHYSTYNYNAPIYTELPPLQSTTYSHLKDEGIGSSSSSRRSSNSSSPVSTESNYSAVRECARCTLKDDLLYFNGHYLCRTCLPDDPQMTPEIVISLMESRAPRRRRSTTAALNVKCSNCESTLSTLWRRSSISGETVCNACGLYEKLHQKARPKSMRKDTIQTRKRKTKASQSAKAKKPPKKSAKSSPETPVEQSQYVPNYTLPNYESLQMKTSHPTLPYLMPEMASHQQVYLNYRPEFNYRHEIYSPVSPNDIISISSPSVSDPSVGIHYTNC